MTDEYTSEEEHRMNERRFGCEIVDMKKYLYEMRKNQFVKMGLAIILAIATTLFGVILGLSMIETIIC